MEFMTLRKSMKINAIIKCNNITALWVKFQYFCPQSDPPNIHISKLLINWLISAQLIQHQMKWRLWMVNNAGCERSSCNIFYGHPSICLKRLRKTITNLSGQLVYGSWLKSWTSFTRSMNVNHYTATRLTSLQKATVSKTLKIS